MRESSTGTLVGSFAGGRSPHWLPDGEHLIYTTAAGVIVARADGSEAATQWSSPSDYSGFGAFVF